MNLILTRRMAIANGTCVSFCNQPKAHYLATSRESRRYVVDFSRFAGAGIWLRQESLRHILASPWYALGKRVQCLSNASQHAPIYIFNRFPVIPPVSSKVRHFSTLFAHFGLPWVCPGRIAVNVTWIEREFNACQTHRSMCPCIFNRLRAIARYWSEIATFSYPPCIYRPRWGVPLEFWENVWTSEN